ncbi:hypothetical protein DPSP01_008450 [Paraphaeosphaeria sporulosa]
MRYTLAAFAMMASAVFAFPMALDTSAGHVAARGTANTNAVNWNEWKRNGGWKDYDTWKEYAEKCKRTIMKDESWSVTSVQRLPVEGRGIRFVG